MKSSNKSGQSVIIGLLIVGLLALALGGYITPIFNLITKPFIETQEWIITRYRIVRDLVSAPEEIADLRFRNQELEAEIASLRTENLSLEQQVTEVEILTVLLDYARAQPQNEYKTASIIARDPRPFLQYVIINRGSDDGIRRGMPVVSSEGLIGRVSSVIANAARVQLITDPTSKVNVQIQPDEVSAVLFGSVTSNLSLDFIPQDSDVQVGDFLQTSGLGGNFPPGIIIGQISSIRHEPTELFQKASIQSPVDFTRLEIVLIIINFETIDLSPLIPGDVIP